MKCPLCKGTMGKSKTNLPYEIGEEYLVVVKGVPALVCKQCGEPFVEIAELRVVEKIVDSAKKDGITLGIVKYKEAA
ncbi:MAG: type II toxin-antitoxin system MqsA family antitoxin [Deltaproteobacteria bacterium]|nr:MAG: type II toxin-antitoxin system MqsA family antitoxin [Deltaproteobacteria bacterium]